MDSSRAIPDPSCKLHCVCELFGDQLTRSLHRLQLPSGIHLLLLGSVLLHGAGQEYPHRSVHLCRDLRRHPRRRLCYLQALQQREPLLLCGRTQRAHPCVKQLPPWTLILICLSKRLHSIYVLRLFNDGVAMLFFYFAVLVWTSKKEKKQSTWTTGTILFRCGYRAIVAILRLTSIAPLVSPSQSR